MDRVSEILYLYEDDVESFADGGTPQSVQPSVDGSRRGIVVYQFLFKKIPEVKKILIGSE